MTQPEQLLNVRDIYSHLLLQEKLNRTISVLEAIGLEPEEADLIGTDHGQLDDLTLSVRIYKAAFLGGDEALIETTFDNISETYNRITDEAARRAGR